MEDYITQIVVSNGMEWPIKQGCNSDVEAPIQIVCMVRFMKAIAQKYSSIVHLLEFIDASILLYYSAIWKEKWMNFPKKRGVGTQGGRGQHT